MYILGYWVRSSEVKQVDKLDFRLNQEQAELSNFRSSTRSQASVSVQAWFYTESHDIKLEFELGVKPKQAKLLAKSN